MRKRRWIGTFHRYVANPVTRRTARFVPGRAVLETTGRRSGLPRRTPVRGGRVEDGSFWLVGNHGREARYVRNIEADPRVRIQIGGRRHAVTAHLCDDDDPHARLRRLPGHHSAMVRLPGTDLLTVGLDLGDR